MTDLRKTTGLGSGTFLASGGSVDGSGAGWPIDKYGNQLTNAQIEQRQAIGQAKKQEPVWCGCGDGIVADDGAKCGVCVMQLQNQIERLKAEREQAMKQEPTAWVTDDFAITYTAEVAQRWRDKGWKVVPFYTAPPMTPEHLPKYITTNGIKPMQGGGGGGSQPEREPVAYFDSSVLRVKHRGSDGWVDQIYSIPSGNYTSPLYAAPPKREWVGLTDDEIWKDDAIMAANSGYGANFETLRELIRAIEVKLREKNT